MPLRPPTITPEDVEIQAYAEGLTHGRSMRTPDFHNECERLRLRYEAIAEAVETADAGLSERLAAVRAAHEAHLAPLRALKARAWEEWTRAEVDRADRADQAEAVQ